MPDIAEIRQQFPMYSDMSDAQLADALHTKFYSDMPRTGLLFRFGRQSQCSKHIKKVHK